MELMQVLHAGNHKLVLLEINAEFVGSLVKQLGFDYRVDDSRRSLILDLTISNRQTPLLLFDATDPANLGWFSRCQFYADGTTGAVLQSPLYIANHRDRSGRTIPNGIRLQILKELPASFRLPGKQPLTEQVVYAILFNFLNALLNVGVAVCGGKLLKPLAGRTESLGLAG
jgi:hypothetical protein